MRNETRFTMASPAPGFTARTMLRIAVYERARARRRALLGAALLVVAASVLFALVCAGLVSWVFALVSVPRLLVAILEAFAMLAFWARALFDAVWVAATAAIQAIGSVPVCTFAVSVFALALLWARVVSGSFQRLPSIAHVGGSK